MSPNPFDQFDTSSAPAAVQSNPFDQFDAPVDQAAAPGRDALGGYLLPAGAGQQQSGHPTPQNPTPGFGDTMLDKATDLGSAVVTAVGRPIGAAVTAATTSGGSFEDRFHAARAQQDANDELLPWFIRYPVEGIAGLASLPIMGAAKAGGLLYDLVPGTARLATGGTGAQVTNALLRAIPEGAAAGAAQALPEVDFRNGAGNALAQVGTSAGVGAALGPATNALFSAAGAGARLVSEAGIGRRNALLPSAPDVRATPGVADVAGRQLAAAASDPVAVQAATAQPAVLVPGSQPTTFQQTGDTGLGQLERGLRTGQGTSQPFIDRDNANNAARVTAIGGAVPETASSSDLVDALTAHRDALAARQADAQQAAQAGTLQDVGGTAADTASQAGATIRQAVDQARAPVLATADQAVQQGQGQLAGALDRLGGVPAGDAGSGQQAYGQRFRQTLATNRATTASNASALHEAVDPNGTLAVAAAPVRQARQQVLDGLSSTTKPPEGEEAAILDVVGRLPATASFRSLADLNTRLGNFIRGQRASASADPLAIRRMTTLQRGVQDAMEGASNLVDIPAAPVASAQSAPAPAAPASAPSVGDAVYTPSGQRVGVRYELADAGDLVTSHGPDMAPNPAYPAELQPPDRSRAASEAQVARIAGQLQPERLGASSTATDGAPIIGPDSVVESGNGRVLALRRAYQQGGQQADNYRAWLESQGHDTSGMAQPVLVRRRTTDLTPAERVQFAAEGNTATPLAMSAPERAAGDARKLTPDVLDTLKPGDVTDPANRDFARSFVRNVVEPGQEGAFAAADGSLSQEGAARVRAAINHRAYDDGGLTASLAESTDPHAKVFAQGMQDAAPSMAKLRAGIERGEVDPAVDIAPSLVEAARVVQSARQRGISLADAVAQQDAFNPVSANAVRLLQHAYGENLAGRMSREAFANSLALYGQRAAEQHAAGSLFGPNLTAEQLMEGTTGRYGRTVAQAGQSSEGAGFVGAGDSPAGYRGGGSVDGPSRAPDTGGGRGGSAGSQGRAVLSEASEQALTPNFDQAAAERYGTARAATRDLKERFDRAPGVGQVLRSGPMAGSYSTLDSEVAPALFSGGKGAAERVQAAVRAGLTPAEITDYAAYDLRRVAGTPDGGMDPVKAAAWQAKNREALSALGRLDPQARGAFDTVQQLAQRVADLRQARTALDATHPLRKLDGDAATAAGVIASGPKGADTFRRALDASGNSPAVVDAARDYLASELRRIAAPGGVVDPAGYTRFANAYGPAMSVRPELRAKFDSAASAQATLDGVAADRAQALQQFQKSAAGHFLPSVDGGAAEPSRAVGVVLGSKTALPQMQSLARLTANDPAARAGLQRAIVEHIQQRFGGNNLAGQTGTTVLQGNALQTFLRKNDAALRAIMSPQQVDTLGKVALDLQRSAASNAGTRAAVGSDTAQNANLHGGFAGTALSFLGEGPAESIGAVAGFFHGGFVGSLGLAKVGAAADKLVARFRAAGIQKASDLVTEAMLNPALANVLLARVNDQTRPNVLKALGVVLGRAAAANGGAGFASAETRRRSD